MSNLVIKKTTIYNSLLIAFPFLVSFSPKINIGFTHARIDELLLLFWVPISLVHFFVSTNYRINRIIAAYYLPFAGLFGLFVFGLFYGENPERLSQPNLIQLSRPLFIIANILVIRYWFYKGHIKIQSVLLSLVLCLTAVGLIGLYSMKIITFGDFLLRTYSPGIFKLNIWYLRFDVSKRAMAVFTGFDVASISYAISILISIYIFFVYRNKKIKYIIFLAVIVLLLSILSSARTGLILIFVGGAVYILNRMQIGIVRKLFIFLLLTIMLISTITIARIILPDEDTINRLFDLIRSLKATDSLLIRTDDIGILFNDHVYNIVYPRGIDVIFGYGDNGNFISDIGYVTIFVKYGLLGILMLFLSFIILAKNGARISKLINITKVQSKYAPINSILPALVIMFAIASLKGGLYFLTFKIGEYFAMIIGFCIVEAEMTLHMLRQQKINRLSSDKTK